MINVLEMLERSAERFPEKTAFADPVKEISFSELLNKSQQVATYLIREQIMETNGQDNSVLFYMEKCVDALPAMFGGIYCNGFYCFLDIRQTVERAAHIISLVNPSVIVTNSENRERLQEVLVYLTEQKTAVSGRVLDIEELRKAAYASSPDQLLLQEARSHFYSQLPLYVNFTSGSTGLPKGVAVGHTSVIDFIQVFTETFEIGPDEILANQAPFDFDVSVKDIYSGLYTGACVRLIPRDYFTNPTLLMDYLCDGKVTTLIWAVTAMCFVSIMNGFGYRNPDSIRKVMFSGEVMPVKQLNKWKQYLPDATYVNLYGPTEITCNCTYHVLDREYAKDEVLPIGRTFKNESVFLLDDNDHLVTEPGVEGEICVSGICLALGYYKDPEKTAKAFTANPVNDRFFERIYRTGDVGKYDEEGLLYYTSRKDFQIKHMGQRIELGDIEVSAMSADGVSRACCIYDHKRSKIILFYTGEIDKEVLSDELHEKLPPFMIPGKTVKLDEFPVNKNGKIDRKALETMK